MVCALHSTARAVCVVENAREGAWGDLSDETEGLRGEDYAEILFTRLKSRIFEINLTL
jgi:hypothetical protein